MIELKILEGKPESEKKKKHCLQTPVRSVIDPTRNTSSMTAMVTSQFQSNLFTLIGL